MPRVFTLIDERSPPAYEETSEGADPFLITADYARLLKWSWTELFRDNDLLAWDEAPDGGFAADIDSDGCLKLAVDAWTARTGPLGDAASTI